MARKSAYFLCVTRWHIHLNNPKLTRVISHCLVYWSYISEISRPAYLTLLFEPFFYALGMCVCVCMAVCLLKRNRLIANLNPGSHSKITNEFTEVFGRWLSFSGSCQFNPLPGTDTIRF